MSEINIETLPQGLPQREHVRPVMTTGLSSNMAMNAGGAALGNIIVGQPPEMGNGFLSLNPGNKADDVLYDPVFVLSYDHEGQLTDSFKREVYDFVVYLKDERGCDIDLNAVSYRLAQTKNRFVPLIGPESGSVNGTYHAESRETSIIASAKAVFSKDTFINIGLHETAHAASGNIYSVGGRNTLAPQHNHVKSTVVGLARGN